jgi:hypothetical protein
MHEISQDEIGSWHDYWLPLSKKRSWEDPSHLSCLSRREDMPVSFVSRGNDFEEMRVVKRRPIEQAFGVRCSIPSMSHAGNLVQSV